MSTCDSSEQRYECPGCNKQFELQRDLLAHLGIGCTPTPPTSEPAPKREEGTLTIDQRFVDRIVARAQNSMMSLTDSEKPKPYDLSQYEHPSIESLAILLVSAHEAKYDLVSIVAAAIEETVLQAQQTIDGLREELSEARVWRNEAEGELIKCGAQLADAQAKLAEAEAKLSGTFQGEEES